MEPIRIFIGTEAKAWLPTEVLKFSISKRTKSPLEFHELKEIEVPLNLKGKTGFSFFRFKIPDLCNFTGKALYLDSDMVCLSDILELYSLNMLGKGALAKVNGKTRFFTSCMLLDTKKLTHWNIDEWVLLVSAGLNSYSAIMEGDPSASNHDDFGPLDHRWNEFDRFDAETKLIHYTTIPTQPWKRPGHPYREPFLKELNSLVKEGLITFQDIASEIEKKHIYEGLIEDMKEFSS